MENKLSGTVYTIGALNQLGYQNPSFSHSAFRSYFEKIITVTGCLINLSDQRLVKAHKFENRNIGMSQGRRRFLKSGTAIERHRRSPMGRRLGRERAREGVTSSLVRGFGRSSPIFFFNLICL